MNALSGTAAAAAAIWLAAASAAGAQDLVAEGAEIYERDCALCHMPDGVGDPPAFPALSGNNVLADVQRIVSNIHEGREAMPPFPSLSAEEIAAVASYIRTAWANSFEPVAADEVARILEDLDTGGELRTIWDGVYTEAQAQRGRAAYTGPCSLCHGRRLDGAPDDPDMRPSPPLARDKFVRNWNGRSLASLFEYSRATMPQSNPGYMEDQTYADIIAHMLSMTGAPPGDEELAPDPQSLARIVIEPEE